MRAWFGCVGLLAVLSGCDCSTGPSNGKGDTGVQPGDLDGSLVLPVDGSVPSVDSGFCGSTGPVITVGIGDAGRQECTGQVAQTTFINSLCTCKDLALAGYLRTRGFNSNNGPYTPGVDEGGAAVGVNNDYTQSVGDTDVGGSMAIAGPDSMKLVGYMRIRGDLRLAGVSQVAGGTDVDRDAWFGDNFTDLGPVNVGRNLHHTGSVIGIPVSVSGTNTKQSVSVNPPCPCTAADILDVQAIVDRGRADNDNVLNGIDPGVLKSVIGTEELTLPCGRYYFDEISGIGQIVVHVNGRVAIYVGGLVTTLGSLKFEMGPKGEMDMFIAGDLTVTGGCSFGSKDRPAATRIYVGGSGDVQLIGGSGFVGNVYAPHSKVTAVGYAEVWGSVVAGDFASPGYAQFIYDRAITTVGQDCPPVNGSCRPCGVCTNGTACVNDKCGPCTNDSDCCSQNTCDNGKCEAVIY
jgi:hypothetical protein